MTPKFTHEEIEKILAEITPGAWESLANMGDLEFLTFAEAIIRQLLDEVRVARTILERLANDTSIDSHGCDCPEIAREALSKLRGEK